MKEARKNGESLLEKLNLSDKKNKPSTALSGGMKRKLHLAMALTGPSEVNFGRLPRYKDDYCDRLPFIKFHVNVRS